MAKPLTLPANKISNFRTCDERLRDPMAYRHPEADRPEHPGGWHIAMLGGMHRDSDAIERANAAEICARLSAATGLLPDSPGAPYGYMRASHWAVGWYEHLVVDPTNETVMIVLRDAAESLEGYPILCEFRLSEMETAMHDDEECGEDCPFSHCDKCGGPESEHGRCERHQPDYLPGCYGDSTLGHQHTREKCAALIESLWDGESKEADEFITALRGPMGDDDGDEWDACEWLQDATKDEIPAGYSWGWHDGDFGLWTEEE